MSGADILDAGRDGVFTFFRVGMPIMLIALAVGFVISLMQALTQIQEQTLVHVPKIVATFLGLLLLMPFMGEAMAGYMARIAALIVAGG
jgi:flagellar biosynthesis protein FliQ